MFFFIIAILDYGRLNVEYAYFLRGKITFHHKHPLVLGKLSLDDYKEKVKNQPEVPLQTRQQMISHLLDLQDMILRVQETIFSFNGRDLHESKVIINIFSFFLNFFFFTNVYFF